METNQSNNVVGGDMVGGNKTVSTNVVLPPKSAIDELNARFKAEYGKEVALSGFISSLQHYLDRMAIPDIRGLAAKLQDSGRTDLVAHAEALKEKATKKILKYQTSTSAQEILVWALAEMYGRFLLKVIPAIEAGKSREEIDALVHDGVIDPVLSGLGENVLSLYRDEVLGLMFFLAGNCHIQWNKSAHISPGV
jgi:hypothetical protein